MIWGGLHGCFLVVNHIWRMTGIKIHAFFGWILTFVAVVIGWVLFRADSVKSALVMLKGMAGGYGVSVPQNFLDIGIFTHEGIITVAPVGQMMAFVSVAIGLAIAFCLPNLAEITRNYYGPMMHKKQQQLRLFRIVDIPVIYAPSVRWSVIAGFVALCGIISLQTSSEFLYFQF